MLTPDPPVLAQMFRPSRDSLNHKNHNDATYDDCCLDKGGQSNFGIFSPVKTHEEHMSSSPKSSNESHRFGRDSDVPQQHRTFAALDIRLVQKSRSAASASCPAKLSVNPQ